MLGELDWLDGQRWTVEESSQAAKSQAGLDEHQVRTWTSWHRWTVLWMLTMAFPVVVTAAERDRTPTPTHLIQYSLNKSAGCSRPSPSVPPPEPRTRPYAGLVAAVETRRSPEQLIQPAVTCSSGLPFSNA